MGTISTNKLAMKITITQQRILYSIPIIFAIYLFLASLSHLGGCELGTEQDCATCSVSMMFSSIVFCCILVGICTVIWYLLTDRIVLFKPFDITISSFNKPTITMQHLINASEAKDNSEFIEED